MLRFLLVVCVACKQELTPADIAERGWRAHELVIHAGEEAKTCVEAGAAMQRVFVAYRQAFVDAVALSNDKERLLEATTYLERNEERYKTIETRMAALSDRCGSDPTVAAAFRQMESP